MSELDLSEHYRTVVAAVDFSPASDRAVEWAAAIAARRGAELWLVHAVDVGPAIEMPMATAVMVGQDLQEAARARLIDISARLEGRVRSVVTEVVTASAVGGLLGAVERLHPELLVVGTRGLRGWRHALLGSTAERLVAAAACPVLAVHEGDPSPPDRPLLAVAGCDGSEDSRCAVRTAARLFDLAPGMLLVHAFQPSATFVTGMFVEASFEPLALARAAAGEMLMGEAEALQREHLDVKPLFRDGYAPEELPAVAQLLHADLLVLGSRGRGGFGHLLLGSVAERVVQQATVPVLVVSHRAAVRLEELMGGLAIVGASPDDEC